MTAKNNFFQVEGLLAPPIRRAAYSDRMAYVLGEMSGLAYFPYEGVDGILSDAAKLATEIILKEKGKDLEEFLSSFADKLYSNKDSNLQAFKAILDEAGFSHIQVFDKSTTQGFLCRRNVPDEPAYLVLAFRGTEQKIDDWLTDAQAIPTQKDGYRVHSGFYKAFNLVADDIKLALNDKACFDERGKKLPLYITGHSLGGALALLATKYISHDEGGSCYTFGAPRVGDYEFFFDIKAPVYRVVNSSDIVPRVPLGAANQLLIGLVKGLGWLLGFSPQIKSLFDWAERQLDKLNGYRHHGDLRYLTDVQGGRFEKVRLVCNPPALDRVQWFWEHLKASFLKPLKSHSCLLYRLKLVEVANYRNKS